MSTTLNFKDVGGFLKRYPIGVVCGTLSVIGLVGYFVRNSRASELKAQLTEVEAQAEQILGNVHNAAELGAQYATLSAATKDMESRLVRGSERARNQQYFYQLESEAGVKEVSLQPNSSDPKKNSGAFCTRISYTISVEGDFAQILGFAGRLESGNYFYRLTSASVVRRGIHATSGTASVINLTLNLELLGLP